MASKIITQDFPKRIAINASNITKGGGLQVASSIIQGLENINDSKYFVIVSSKLAKWARMTDGYMYNNVFVWIHDVPKGQNVLSGHVDSLDSFIAKNSIQVVISIFGPTYWKPKVFHICGFAKPHYIYDELIPEGLFSKKEMFNNTLKRLIHLHNFKSFIDILYTETEDATMRLRKLLPSKKVVTITNTYHQIYNDPNYWIDSPKMQLDDARVILMIASLYKHKNHQIIPKVIRILKELYPEINCKFILTINKNELGDGNSDVYDSIIFLGQVPIELCPNLYLKSDIMFLPTLLECFSASYAESMKMNVPILTSDRPFARTVCHNAAEYCDPLNETDIAEKIVMLLNNIGRRNQLIAFGKNRLNCFETSHSRLLKMLSLIPEP